MSGPRKKNSDNNPKTKGVDMELVKELGIIEFARNNRHAHIFNELEMCKYCGFSKHDKKRIENTCNHPNVHDIYRCGKGTECLDCGYVEFKPSSNKKY
jgi:hypothetical protein